MRRFPIFLAMLLAAVPAWAWGPEGHEIVAAIAARELQPATRANISALLGGDPGTLMILDSSWADEIRTDRPQTVTWHYVNIEIDTPGYNAARDCPRAICVTAQIDRDLRLLAAPRTPGTSKVEALRFLVHFIGDLHQPLHAADRHDKGGNDVTVSYRGKRTSLHRIWDHDVVLALGANPVRVAANIVARLTPAQKARMAGGTPADWTNESFALAAHEIYGRFPAGDPIYLPADYARRESGVARSQLAKAGLRLAAALNRIFAR
jgi:hypothetical protein